LRRAALHGAPLALVLGGEAGACPKLALLLLRSVLAKGGMPDGSLRTALANTRSATSRTLACALPPMAGHPLGPTARLQRKSAVCGLNGLLPRLRLGSLHLNPRPPKVFRALAPPPFLRRGKRKRSSFRFGKKIALGAHFPSKTESKRFREGRRGSGQTRPNQAPAG